MNDIFINTHIVFDAPEPISTKVMALRKKYNDLFRSSLPVEITLTGSSGIGVLDQNQNPQHVYDEINNIATRIKPVKTSFGSVIRFPNTDIFVFSLTDEDLVTNLHNELKLSPIKFHNNPFPYKPHCTIRSVSPITIEDEQEIYMNTISDEFILDTISVYSLIIDNNGKVTLPLHHRVKLTG